jgi:hypothetical protein
LAKKQAFVHIGEKRLKAFKQALIQLESAKLLCGKYIVACKKKYTAKRLIDAGIGRGSLYLAERQPEKISLAKYSEMFDIIERLQNDTNRSKKQHRQTSHKQAK